MVTLRFNCYKFCIITFIFLNTSNVFANHACTKYFRNLGQSIFSKVDSDVMIESRATKMNVIGQFRSRGLKITDEVESIERYYQILERRSKDNRYSNTKEVSILFKRFKEALQESSSERLQSKLELIIDVFKIVSEDYLYFGSSPYLKTFRQLVVMEELEEGFASLGRAVTKIQVNWLAQSVSRSLQALFSNLDTLSIDTINLILKRYGDQLYRYAIDVGLNVYYSGNPFNFKLFDVYSPKSEEFQRTLSALRKYSYFFGSYLEKAVSSVIAIKARNWEYILNRLELFDWALSQSYKDRHKLFNILMYLSSMAEASKNPEQAELLKNTFNFALSGSVKIYIEELEGGVAGAASHHNNHIYISNREHHYNSWSSYNYIALNVLAHEVSHILSKQGAEKSVAYFEEEYRAWYVGFIAQFGRRPNRSEASQRAKFLLEFDISDHTHPYSYIARSFMESPASYVQHLAELGLNREDMTNSSIKDSVEWVNLSENEAPIWGCWSGCLENKSRY